MPISKATRDVLDLSVRPVTAIDVNVVGGNTKLIDNVQIGSRVPNTGVFTTVNAATVTVNAAGTLDLSAAGVVVLGKLRAYYADIAEYYEADAVYPCGTILQYNTEGNTEVTMAKWDGSWIGVVSTDPFIVLNENFELDVENAVLIALSGRIPCRVTGPVRCGDYIVLSTIPGVGTACLDSHGKSRSPEGPAIGRVLKTDLNWEERLVEIKVG